MPRRRERFHPNRRIINYRQQRVSEPVAQDPIAGVPRPFDVHTIEHLIDLMARHELGEIELVEGDHRIRLRKGGLAASAATVPVLQTHAQQPVAATAPAPVATVPAPTPAAKVYHGIQSPMVGTFYSKPAPDKPDYVSVGSVVGPNTVVCKLEAMKIFNDIMAEVSGTIVEVCVKNGQSVDFGTVLFKVDLG